MKFDPHRLSGGMAGTASLAPPQPPRDGAIRRMQNGCALMRANKNPPTIRRLSWETEDGQS